MFFLKTKNGSVVDSCQSAIVADIENDCFLSQGRVWLDPRPSSGAYAEDDGQHPPVDLLVLVPQHWEAIKQERDRRTQAGGYQVDGKWFHSDTFSRTQQMGLVMMGANIPANLRWKTMDGSFVTMTQTLAGQVFVAAAASDAALFARAEQIKAAMEADPVNFVLASQTWPAVFEG